MFVLVELRIDNEALKDSAVNMWSFGTLDEAKEA